MAAPELVETEKAIGMAAAKVLWKDSTLKPTAVLWLYDEDAGEWKFLVATEDVHKRGPQAAYMRVRNVLKEANLLVQLPLQRIVIVPPSNPFLIAVGGTVRAAGDEPSGMSFYDCTFNGLRVSGLHIYYLDNKRGEPAHSLS